MKEQRRKKRRREPDKEGKKVGKAEKGKGVRREKEGWHKETMGGRKGGRLGVQERCKVREENEVRRVARNEKAGEEWGEDK